MPQPKKQEVLCPRCGRAFLCQPEDIDNCQCNRVVLSRQALDYVSQHFKGCLCAGCLQELEMQMNTSNISP